MSKKKKKHMENNFVQEEKTFYNLDYVNDRNQVEFFEKNFKKYLGKTEVRAGHTLGPFEIMCLRNNFITYSKEYQEGAMVERNLPEYRKAKALYDALTKLHLRREHEKKKDKEQLDFLADNN